MLPLIHLYKKSVQNRWVILQNLTWHNVIIKPECFWILIIHIFISNIYQVWFMFLILRKKMRSVDESQKYALEEKKDHLNHSSDKLNDAAQSATRMLYQHKHVHTHTHTPPGLHLLNWETSCCSQTWTLSSRSERQCLPYSGFKVSDGCLTRQTGKGKLQLG